MVQKKQKNNRRQRNVHNGIHTSFMTALGYTFKTFTNDNSIIFDLLKKPNNWAHSIIALPMKMLLFFSKEAPE